jgi:hypothetical protein
MLELPRTGMLIDANAGLEFGLTITTGREAFPVAVEFPAIPLATTIGSGAIPSAMELAAGALTEAFEDVGIAGGTTDAVAFAFAVTITFGVGDSLLALEAEPVVIETVGVAAETKAVALAGVAVTLGDFINEGSTALAVAIPTGVTIIIVGVGEPIVPVEPETVVTLTLGTQLVLFAVAVAGTASTEIPLEELTLGATTLAVARATEVTITVGICAIAEAVASAKLVTAIETTGATITADALAAGAASESLTAILGVIPSAVAFATEVTITFGVGAVTEAVDSETDATEATIVGSEILAVAIAAGVMILSETLIVGDATLAVAKEATEVIIIFGV